MEIHKILPVKASWDDTVWKGPIDFIASQAGGKGELQPARGPHEVEADTPRSSKSKQRRNRAKEVREVSLAVNGFV